MREFKINEFITLRLEGVKTNIYIAEEKFRHCMHIQLNILLDELKIDDYVEIPEVELLESKLNGLLEKKHYLKYVVSPEDEFWVHCSNIQVWAENNYDASLLNSPLAYNLLRKLVEVGDPKAKRALVVRGEPINITNINVFVFKVGKETLKFLNREEISRCYKDLVHKFFITLNYKQVVFQYLKLKYLIRYFRRKCPDDLKKILLENIFNRNYKLIRLLLKKSFKDLKLVEWKELIENPNFSLFDVVSESTENLKQERKNLIEELSESYFLISREKSFLIGLIEIDEEHYEASVFMLFYELSKLSPESVKKKIIESFRKHNLKIIDFIIRIQRLYDFNSEEIANLPGKIQSRMIKILIQYFDYSKYNFIGTELTNILEVEWHIAGLLEKFYDAGNHSRKILIKTLNDAFQNPNYIVIKSLLRTISSFKKPIILINKIDCSKQSVFEGILFLIKNTEDISEELEDFHDYFKKVLYNLGKKQIKHIKSKIIQKIKQGNYENFLAIIKLGWLEHFKDKDFRALLYNNKLNFIEHLIKYLNVSLSLKDSWLRYDRINFCLGLIYRIFIMPEKKNFNDLMDGIATNIRLFIDSIYFLLSNEIMPEYINKNVKEQGSEMLKTLNPKYFPLNF